MHPITALATGIAAIVGIAAGVTVALVVDDGSRPSAHHASPTTSGASRPTALRTPAAPQTGSTSGSVLPRPRSGTLLYVGNGRIFDGHKVIPFARRGRVHDLRRTVNGYLVGTAVSPQDATFVLWNVRRDGTSTRLGRVGPIWDVNADGSRAVAYDADAGMLRVWDLRTGRKVAGYTTEGSDGDLTAGFAGHDLLISQTVAQNPGEPDRIDLVRWDPDRGITSSAGPRHRNGYRQMSVSPGGSYLAGLVGPRGSTQNALDRCLHVESTYLKRYDVSWFSCDWTVDGRPVRFSPDGTRLLAVPVGAGRGRPDQVGVLDASDGPGTPVATFRPPSGTDRVEWADDDHVWASGSFDQGEGQSGTWIRRCDFDGTCGAAVRTLGPATVASGY